VLVAGIGLATACSTPTRKAVVQRDAPLGEPGLASAATSAGGGPAGTASAHAGAADASAPVPGGAECTSDADCVTTMLAGGCCLFYCVPYAVSRAEAARRESVTAACRQPCPPPAPCRPRDYDVKPVCKAGACTGEKVPHVPAVAPR
jgi:hypothetical protein